MTHGMVLNYIFILCCRNEECVKGDKELRYISKGRVRDRGVTWFHELADKREDCFTLTKVHLLVGICLVCL